MKVEVWGIRVGEGEVVHMVVAVVAVVLVLVVVVVAAAAVEVLLFTRSLARSQHRLYLGKRAFDSWVPPVLFTNVSPCLQCKAFSVATHTFSCFVCQTFRFTSYSVLTIIGSGSSAATNSKSI